MTTFNNFPNQVYAATLTGSNGITVTGSLSPYQIITRLDPNVFTVNNTDVSINGTASVKSINVSASTGYGFIENSDGAQISLSGTNVGIGTTAPTEMLHVFGNIKSTGNLVLDNAGGVVFGTTAGGTGANTSNTLSDYEEGTWTPTVTGTGQAYTTQTGKYIKIGKNVNFWFNLNVSFTTLDFFIINGLPFTNNNSQNGSAVINDILLANTGFTNNIVCKIPTASAVIYFIKNFGFIINESIGLITDTDTGTSISVCVSGFYSVY